MAARCTPPPAAFSRVAAAARAPHGTQALSVRALVPWRTPCQECCATVPAINGQWNERMQQYALVPPAPGHANRRGVDRQHALLLCLRALHARQCVNAGPRAVPRQRLHACPAPRALHMQHHLVQARCDAIARRAQHCLPATLALAHCAPLYALALLAPDGALHASTS
ncbi:hypothetical protein DFH07DRAFT_953456 [Mycena maculata]|uniref:Uncharacterized protein n=1 Tax=Mycena maculata TaxID=230809 RepID=A0AAD7NQA9_9AGAR|nr:hypothetical protein DFH07DRAFT_953456 [Mycena maculata]